MLQNADLPISPTTMACIALVLRSDDHHVSATVVPLHGHFPDDADGTFMVCRFHQPGHVGNRG